MVLVSPETSKVCRGAGSSGQGGSYQLNLVSHGGHSPAKPAAGVRVLCRGAPMCAPGNGCVRPGMDVCARERMCAPGNGWACPGMDVCAREWMGVVEEGRHVEGRHVEGRHVEGRHVEGRHVEGRHVEGRHVEGRHAGLPLPDNPFLNNESPSSRFFHHDPPRYC